MMRRQILYHHVISVVLSGVLLLLAYGTPAIAKSSQPESVKLKVLWLSYLSLAPFFIAEEEGYFTEQGIEIEFVEIKDFEAAFPALVQGELDIVTGTIRTGVLNAIARGAAIKIVADKSYIDPMGCTCFSLLARSNLAETGKLDNSAQLKGRRIVFEPQGVSGYYLEKLLTPVGLTLKDVEATYLPPQVRAEALQKELVDLVLSSEPWITLTLQAGYSVIWNPAQKVIPNFQVGIILFGPTLLEGNPDAGRRFMIAYLKAVRQYNEGKTERNLEILGRYTKLDLNLLKELCWPSFRADGRINLDSLLDFQAWALEKGYINTPVTKEQLWDSRFIDYADQLLSNK
jgi:NitT/TauT family transport system substrate-binding protein